MPVTQKEPEDDEDKRLDMHITRRLRNPEAFIESESAFDSQFKLMNEFSNKYEYKMTGKFELIHKEIHLLRDRLEKYMKMFPERTGDQTGGATLRSMQKRGMTKSNLNLME